MRVQFALPSGLTALTRSVTVAAGRFAPGHLGELTAVVPFELVDAVLAETRPGLYAATAWTSTPLQESRHEAV